jgi:hypothetical protein
LLDRGYGRATNVFTGDDEQAVAIHFTWAPAREEPLPASTPPTIDGAPSADAAADAEDVHPGPVIVWSSDKR